MNTTAPKVFVVDDDPSFLGGMVRLLRAAEYAVQGFSSAREALEKIPVDGEGCLLLDLHMPEMSGIELQAVLARYGNPITVVFLTGAGDIPSSVQAIKGGAEDFLVKTAPKEEIFAAIDRALQRNRRERLRVKQNRELQEKFAQLTPRENEVLQHVLHGRLNKQIAFQLGIDERSVKRHRTNFMRKLEVSSVAELVQSAIEAGVLNDAGSSHHL
jgi:RNA polymerase sigma factor (sigma-70 family)